MGEAETCLNFVVPKPQAAVWNASDHRQIGEFTKLFGGADKLRGRLNELQTLLFWNIWLLRLALSRLMVENSSPFGQAGFQIQLKARGDGSGYRSHPSSALQNLSTENMSKVTFQGLSNNPVS
jgi:hypothetical protein